MKVESLIFDMDGTLWDSAATVAAEIMERKRFTMGKAAAALVKTDDPKTVAELVRAITAQDVELARLYGLTQDTVNVTVTHQSPTSILREAQERLCAVIDAEVVDEPRAIEP